MQDEGAQRFKERQAKWEDKKKRREKKDAAVVVPPPVPQAVSGESAKDTAKLEVQLASLVSKIEILDTESKRRIKSLEAKMEEQAQATRRMEERMLEVQSSISSIAKLLYASQNEVIHF